MSRSLLTGTNLIAMTVGGQELICPKQVGLGKSRLLLGRKLDIWDARII